jgi:hypothetical protein
MRQSLDAGQNFLQCIVTNVPIAACVDVNVYEISCNSDSGKRFVSIR